MSKPSSSRITLCDTTRRCPSPPLTPPATRMSRSRQEHEMCCGGIGSPGPSSQCLPQSHDSRHIGAFCRAFCVSRPIQPPQGDLCDRWKVHTIWPVPRPNSLENTAGNHCATKDLCELRRYDKGDITSSRSCKPYAGLIHFQHETHVPEVPDRFLMAAVKAYCPALSQVFAFPPRQKSALQQHEFGRLQSSRCNELEQGIHNKACPNSKPKGIVNKGIPFQLDVRTHVQRRVPNRQTDDRYLHAKLKYSR